MDSIEKPHQEWLDGKKFTDSVLRDFYYLIGDYYMKNNDRINAVKNYLMDIAFNPGRFDSWAALALCKGKISDKKLIYVKCRFISKFFNKSKVSP